MKGGEKMEVNKQDINQPEVNKPTEPTKLVQDKELNKNTNADDLTKLIDDKLANYSKRQDELKNLTETEKARKLLEEREEKLLEREKETKTKEFKLLASEKLKTENIPSGLLEFLNYTDEKTFNNSLSNIIDVFKKSVETVVTEKLKTEPPKIGTNTGVDVEDEEMVLKIMGLT